MKLHKMYKFVSYDNGILCTRHYNNKYYYDFNIKKWSSLEPPDDNSNDLDLEDRYFLIGFAKEEIDIILKYYDQFLREDEINFLFRKLGYSI